MTTETAVAILQAAKEGGYLEGAIPTDEESVLKDAKFYYDHAISAKENGIEDPTINIIIQLGAPKPTDGYVEEGPTATGPEHLPVPLQIEGEIDPMPRDLSEVSDKGIRKLSGEYNAALARTIWLLSEVLTDVSNLKVLRDDVYSREYLAQKRAADNSETRVLKDELELAARSTEEYRKLDAQVREAEDLARKYTALKEIYKGHLDRLSREATLRDDEWKRSGGGR